MVSAKIQRAYLAFDQPGYNNAKRLDAATRIIRRFGVNGDIQPAEIVHHNTHFMAWLESGLKAKKIIKSIPVQHKDGDRWYRENLDYLVETSNGISVIRFENYSGKAAGRKTRIQDAANKSYLSGLALAKEYPNVEIRNFIYFVLTGKLVELEIVPKSKQMKLEV